MTDTARRGALSLLLRWESREGYANLTADDGRLAAMPPRERAFMTALFYGTVERRLRLDYAIGVLTARSPEALTPHTRAALRLGLYQLLYMPSVPPHAAVSESVALGRDRGERALLNAALRAAADRAPTSLLPDESRDPLRYLSVRESVPLPTVKYFAGRLGREALVPLLSAFNTRPPLSMRVNTLKTTREALLSRLLTGGYAARPDPLSPFGILLDGTAAVTTLPGFSEGEFFVQDTASQLTTLLLDPHPHETVLDLCACPGGKSFGAAIAMGDTGRVISRDARAAKLPLIREGAARLGLSSLTVEERDATLPDPAHEGTVDRIICDVPCSGLGVIAKKPDLRYRPLSSVGELCALSARILAAAATALRPGGTMVFSTCTLTAEENEDTVRAFLAAHPDVFAEDFTLGPLSSKEGMLTLWPHLTGTDGFFMAKLRRT
ncbi:MAG: 16S rRNA (cytosine(967)-C(5))-methyltransferase RsmB [Clostridia bacterium]|nr:16S rRNA (cytosine(967)-C(5))-methyltransferase RsmB [Clostridia bacterium]